MMKPIPTVGPRGIQFRSRIEAQWAYIFQELGWVWEYEPIDLNGYIPDFIISFDKQQLLVEIKSSVDIWNHVEHNAASDKILKSGWDGLYVILGSRFKAGSHVGWHNIGVYGSTRKEDWNDCCAPIIDDIVLRQYAIYNKKEKECIWVVGGDTMAYDIDLEPRIPEGYGFCEDLSDRKWDLELHKPERYFCDDLSDRKWKGTLDSDFDLIWSNAKNMVQWKRPVV